MSTASFEDNTPHYDNLAAQLLAEIADALLSGKQDWKTLERLKQALDPKPTFPKPTTPTYGTPLNEHSDYISESLKPDPDSMEVTRKMIEEIWKPTVDAQLRESLRDAAKRQPPPSGPTYISTTNPGTYNNSDAAARWYGYSVKPTRRPKGDPGKT